MMTADRREEFEDLLDMADMTARSGWERTFVEDMECELHNPFWEPTEKQWAKAREIAERDE